MTEEHRPEEHRAASPAPHAAIDGQRRALLQLALSGGAAWTSGALGSLSPATSALAATTGSDAIFRNGFEPAVALPAVVPARVLNESGGTAVRFSGGMAFREGDIPDGYILACPALAAFQGHVLNRWPDGSVKFAVLAGMGTLPDNATTSISVTGAAGSLGAPVSESVLIAAAPDAVITFSGVGSVALADLLGVTSTLSGGRYTAGRVRTNFEGPVCSSWTYYARIAGHPHLSAWFEVRCWADGAREILPWVENGWWNVPAPQAYAGTVSFRLDAATPVSLAITHYSQARPALLPANPEPYRVGARFATLLHDPAYLQSTRLVPTYWATADEAKLATLGQNYTPMAPGDEGASEIPNVMGSGGYSPTIGVLSESDAIFVSGADRRARRTMLKNAFMYGRFPVHYRDETTNRMVAPSAYPTRVLNSTNTGIASISASSANDYTPAIVGPHTTYYWADSHHPSAGYAAYLHTGWHYHIETTQAVAGVCCYRMNNVHRQNGDHLFRGESVTATGSQRGNAWAVRTLVQATLAPDGDPLQAAMLGVLQINMDRNYAIYVAQPNNPFGFVADQDAYSPAANGSVQPGATSTVIPLGPTASDGLNAYVNRGPWTLTIGGVGRQVTAYDAATRRATVGTPFPGAPAAGAAWNLSNNRQEIPIWMHDFITLAWSHLLNVAPIPSTLRIRMRELFAWKARSVVQRCGPPGVAGAFNYVHAAQFELVAFPADTVDVLGGTGPFFSDWGAIYQATLGTTNTADPGGNDAISPAYGSWPTTQGSWAICIAALSQAVEHGVPGADVALARITHDPQWPTFLSNLQTSPVWGLRPQPARLPLADQAVGTAIDYSLNRISDIDPGPTTSREGDYTQAGASELFIAWGGMGWSPWTSRGYFMGNGHGSGCANDVYQFDARTRSFSIVKPRAPWSVVQFTAGAKTWEADSTASVIALQPNLSSAADGAYVGWTIQIGGETRTISAYTGGLVRRATVSPPFGAAPVNQPYFMTDGSSRIGMLTQPGTTPTAIVLPSSANASDGYHYGHRLQIGSATAQIGPYPGYIGATRTANLTTPIPGAAAGQPVHIDALTGYIADPVSGWMYTNKKGIEVDVGQPFGAHTYGWTGTLPPNALTPNGPANTAPLGYYYTPGNSTMPLVGSDGTGQTAVLPIGSSRFQAVGTPFPGDPAHGGSLFDVFRHLLVQFNDANTATKPALHVLTGAQGTIDLGAVFYAYSAMCAHSERHDLYTGLVIPSAAEGGIRFFLSDRRFNTHLPHTFAGTPPAQQGSGRHYALCWVEPWQCWAAYAADGSNTVHFLKLPPNPRAVIPVACTWVSRTLTGTIHSHYAAGPNPPYNRLAAIRESCNDEDGMFLWFPRVDRPAQRFRVARP